MGTSSFKSWIITGNLSSFMSGQFPETDILAEMNLQHQIYLEKSNLARQEYINTMRDLFLTPRLQHESNALVDHEPTDSCYAIKFPTASVIEQGGVFQNMHGDGEQTWTAWAK